jgi:Spy/CpxP family protein refolding chaperone
MKMNLMILALVAGSLVMSPLTVSAQPSDSAKGKRMERMFADLNLTKDQQAKLKALHETLKGSHKQVFDQMKALREKTKAELLKPQPSGKVLDGYATLFGDLQKQLAQKRNGHMLQIKAILTPEQFAKLLSREEKGPGSGPRGDKGNGCKGGRGPGPGGPDDDE